MTTNQPNAAKHYLIAAWPGMANVAVLAAGYLIQKLGLKQVAELPPRGHFDIQAVEVKKGIVGKPRLPRSLLYSGNASPDGTGPTVTVFIGESQPVVGHHAFAHALMERAQQLGVDRVITFASMASQIHPSDEPTVHAAATSELLLEDLARIDVRILEEGQISGLNGVLLGVASEKNLPGLCLLGEIPFFAVGVPNPKAAKAVLTALSSLIDLNLDLESLNDHIEAIHAVHMQMLERMQGHGSSAENHSSNDEPIEHAPERTPAKLKQETPIDPALAKRIEALFEQAEIDRSKAADLKAELDKHNLFRRYENRFLDLFKRAD